MNVFEMTLGGSDGIAQLPECCQDCGLLAYREYGKSATYWCRDKQTTPIDGKCRFFKYKLYRLAHLVEALQILLKYGNPNSPVSGYQDCLWVSIEASSVTDRDKRLLGVLGFEISKKRGVFVSCHFS